MILLSCILIGLLMPFGRILAAMPFVGGITRLSGYAQSIDKGLGVFSNPTTLKQLAFVGGGLFFYKQLISKVPHYRLLFTSYFLSVCWLMVWNDFPVFAGRFAMYFSITEVVVIPCFLYLFNRRSQVLVMSILVLFAFVVLYLNSITFLTKEMGYYPYRIIVLNQ